MTRKDFQLIADVVSEIDNVDTRNQVALNFVTTLHATNNKFDSVRFLLACKVNIKNKAKRVNDDDESRRKENFVAP
jgi:hypothetical protein|tara:strand:+ start:2933 stop:3160 length:228 start_codon:yes stop_codon:yes gene_type:complete